LCYYFKISVWAYKYYAWAHNYATAGDIGLPLASSAQLGDKI